jgi:hypothetical protein
MVEILKYDPEYTMFQYSLGKGTFRQRRISLNDQELTLMYLGLKVTTPVMLMEANNVLAKLL